MHLLSLSTRGHCFPHSFCRRCLGDAPAESVTTSWSSRRCWHQRRLSRGKVGCSLWVYECVCVETTKEQARQIEGERQRETLTRNGSWVSLARERGCGFKHLANEGSLSPWERNKRLTRSSERFPDIVSTVLGRFFFFFCTVGISSLCLCLYPTELVPVDYFGCFLRLRRHSNMETRR